MQISIMSVWRDLVHREFYSHNFSDARSASILVITIVLKALEMAADFHRAAVATFVKELAYFTIHPIAELISSVTAV